MKKLNQHSTKIFIQIMEKLGRQSHCKLKATGFMDLVIEEVGEVQTEWGNGKQVSLAHYYEQNGDLMRDPEMVFIVVDNRGDNKYNLDLIGIYPQMFQQDSFGLYEESIRIEQGIVTSFIEKWQTAHCVFAHEWLKNIKAQGFLI